MQRIGPWTWLRLFSPALRALCGRPRIASRATGNATERARYSEDHASWRGVRVVGSGPEEDCPRDNAGAYEGSDLFLREDGSFVTLDYSGRWSRWQGASNEWEAEESGLTLAQVARRYDAEDIVSAIEAALRRYVEGNATKRAEQLRAKADRLAAVAKLV